jgi:uncharacterized membrane protein HdeD (DUF308 family)
VTSRQVTLSIRRLCVRRHALTVVAAAVLAIEGLVLIWVHVQYRELPPIILSGAVGLLMAFIAYGRTA